MGQEAQEPLVSHKDLESTESAQRLPFRHGATLALLDTRFSRVGY